MREGTRISGAGREKGYRRRGELKALERLMVSVIGVFEAIDGARFTDNRRKTNSIFLRQGRETSFVADQVLRAELLEAYGSVDDAS